jgi:V/A-type H+/Na+-transporting ATPase subunit D
MRLRIPPGRAGRLWLLRRLAVTRRGRDVLEQKQRALLGQLARLETELAEARDAWNETAREAEVWWQRAAVLAGERPLELSCATQTAAAHVSLEWRNALGVFYPAEADVVVSDGELFPAGGSAALAYAAERHRLALEAAARLGAAQLAHARVSAELRSTRLRVRAIERRWLPALEAALQTLELALDETEREDAVRVRWFAARGGSAPAPDSPQ